MQSTFPGVSGLQPQGYLRQNQVPVAKAWFHCLGLLQNRPTFQCPALNGVAYGIAARYFSSEGFATFSRMDWPKNEEMLLKP